MILMNAFEDAFGEESFREFLDDYACAVLGEFEPLQRWGVALSVRELSQTGESVSEATARQLSKVV